LLPGSSRSASMMKNVPYLLLVETEDEKKGKDAMIPQARAKDDAHLIARTLNQDLTAEV